MPKVFRIRAIGLGKMFKPGLEKPKSNSKAFHNDSWGVRYVREIPLAKFRIFEAKMNNLYRISPELMKMRAMVFDYPKSLLKQG